MADPESNFSGSAIVYIIHPKIPLDTPFRSIVLYFFHQFRRSPRMGSVVKKRRKKMTKHKYRKRMKQMRHKNK